MNSCLFVPSATSDGRPSGNCTSQARFLLVNADNFCFQHSIQVFASSSFHHACCLSIRTHPIRRVTQAELDGCVEKASDILRGYDFALLWAPNRNHTSGHETSALFR